MKRWISLLLSLLLVLGMGSAVMAEEGAKDPLGDIGDNTYTNGLFGFKAVLPDSWRFLSYTDMAGYMGYDQVYASHEGLAALLEKNGNVCAMYAAATDDSSANMIFAVEDLGQYSYLDEATYYSIAEGSMADALPQGFTDIQLNKKTFEVAGAEHAGGELTAKLGSFQMFMDVVIIKADKYIGTLTITALSQEKTEEVLSFFEPLEGAETVLSTFEGQKYENKALDISADFDKGWYLMNEEERAQQMGLLDNVIHDEDLLKVLTDALESGKSICDMKAQKKDGSGDEVNIILSDLGAIGMLFVDERQYFEMSEEGLYSAYRSMGCQEITITGGETVLCGRGHYGAEIEASLNGTRFFQRQVYIKSGKYIGVLTIFSKDRSQLDVITGMFKPCA